MLSVARVLRVGPLFLAALSNNRFAEWHFYFADCASLGHLYFVCSTNDATDPVDMAVRHWLR
jgi:hypothetical protein